MITNYAHQKELMQARFDIKTCDTMLANIINEGTSCSPFESDVIVNKAKEVYCIGEYSEGRILDIGQLVWYAVSSCEPAGKPLEKCQMKRVVLTYIDQKGDAEIYREYGLSARRRVQIQRMTLEAMDQGALLSQEDLSHIMGNDVRTIREDIKKIKDEGIVVATRGQQKDIGRGITHREQAIKMFLENKEPVEISRGIKHSLRSVERYIETFCRIIYCHDKVEDRLQTALTVGVSKSLVDTYLELEKEYLSKDEYKKRLKEIRSRGRAYFDASDFKKNASRSVRGQK